MLNVRLLKKIALQNSRSFSLSITKRVFVRTTVDQHEVDQHKQFADDWWDEKHGPVKALHSMNSIRIPLIRIGLTNTGRLKEDDPSPQYMHGIKILDVGCGGGILSIIGTMLSVLECGRRLTKHGSWNGDPDHVPQILLAALFGPPLEPLSRLGAEVTGIDPSPELINVATREAETRLCADSKVQFLTSTVEDHCPANKELYDAIVLSEVIEHVTHKEEFIQICLEALKPTGSIFFTSINRTMASWLGAIVTAEYILSLLPRGTHDWEKFPTPEELKKYLDIAGCKTMLSCGIMYQPLLNEWSWVSNTSINYVLHAVKPV